MICPSCKCEYIRGVNECADCGVALVDALDPSAPEADKDLEIVAVWQGDDPVEIAAVKEALEKAGIPVLGQGPTGYFIYPSQRPKTEICVSSQNVERAQQILQDLEASDSEDEITPEEWQALELPDSEAPENEDPANTGTDLSEPWYEDDPAAEVWSGESEQFADGLIACYREVGIESRKLLEEGRWRVMVRPELESRARKIVREVMEGRPLE